MNLPIGLLGLFMATVYLPEGERAQVPPLDVRGFILSGVGLSCTVFGLTVIGRDLLTLPQTIALIAVGLVSVAAYVRHARVAKNPILDLRLLSVQTLRASVLAGFFYRVAAGAIPFLLPLLLQICFHATPLQSGLITCVSALGALLMKFMAAGLLKRFGFRQLLIVNGFLSCAFMAAMAAFTATTPLLAMYFILLMGGFARSLQFTSLNTIAYSDIPNAAIARANGLYTVAQQLSLALGVALAALVLEASQWLRGAVDLGQRDFAAAFMVVAIGGLLALPSFYKLKPTAGDAVSGHVAGA